MGTKTFGYARVSTKEQNLDRQINQLLNYIDDERDILSDQKTGKDFNRENYNIFKKILRDGDTLVVTSMDRLGRNKSAIMKELQYFKENNIRVKILDIPTTLINIDGIDLGLSKTLLDMVNNILIEVLSTIAQTEYETIKKRQAEGIDAAKARGQEFGRPKVKYPPMWEIYYTQWRTGTITAKTFMDNVELKRSTFYKLVNRYKKEKVS